MNKSNELERRSVVSRLLANRGDAVVVPGLGSTNYDLAAAGDHERNFYIWGAMGGAAMIGLGIALAQPKVPVIVITGDGELLMGIGGLATIALQNPGNLSIIALDNEHYGETGGQKSHTAGKANLGKIAAGCGIDDVRTITTMAEVENLAERITRIGDAPLFATIKISSAELPRILPFREAAFLKGRLRRALGQETF